MFISITKIILLDFLLFIDFFLLTFYYFITFYLTSCYLTIIFEEKLTKQSDESLHMSAL